MSAIGKYGMVPYLFTLIHQHNSISCLVKCMVYRTANSFAFRLSGLVL